MPARFSSKSSVRKKIVTENEVAEEPEKSPETKETRPTVYNQKGEVWDYDAETWAMPKG